MDDSVRLTGGPNEFEGCAMQWTSADVEVVCRQLGHNTDCCELLTDLSHMCLIYSCSSNSSE